MAEDVADITVAVEAAGADMAQGQLEGLEDQLEETARSAEGQADAMGDISERWQGTMSALVTGLAVASAGLLSQVPVLGEAFGGLASVVEAVAFQMDQVLRPILQPITDGLFGLSSAIFNADGVMGTFIGVLGTVTTFLLGVVAPLTAVAAKIFGLSTVIAVVKGALLTAIGVVSSVVGAIGAIPLAIAAVVAAVVGFVAAYITNWNGVRDKTNKVVGKIVGFIKGLASDALEWAQNTVKNIASGIAEFAQDAVAKGKAIATDIADALSGLVSDALEWGRSIPKELAAGISEFIQRVATGAATLASKVATEIKGLADDATGWAKDMIDEFVKGLKQASSRLAEGVKKHVAQTIRDHLPGSPAKVGPLSDLDQTGPGLVDTFAGGIEANVGTVESAGDALGQAADPSGIPAQSSTNLSVFLSGRQAESATAQYRDDAVLNRGRPQ